MLVIASSQNRQGKPTMPPKARFSPESIIEAAFNVVQAKGWAGLSARSIAKELNASTGPIYSHLNSMGHLEEAIMKKGIDLCLRYVRIIRTGDRWIDQGIGYALFARDEKHLFRSINDEKYLPIRGKYDPYFWKALDEDLGDYPLFRDLPDDARGKIRHARSVFSFGMASMLSSSIEYEMMKTESQIIELVKTVSFSLYKGIMEATAISRDNKRVRLRTAKSADGASDLK